MRDWQEYIPENADTCTIRRRTCNRNFEYRCTLLQAGQVIKEFVISDQYLSFEEIKAFQDLILAREKMGLKLILTNEAAV